MSKYYPVLMLFFKVLSSVEVKDS